MAQSCHDTQKKYQHEQKGFCSTAPRFKESFDTTAVRHLTSFLINKCLFLFFGIYLLSEVNYLVFIYVFFYGCVPAFMYLRLAFFCLSWESLQCWSLFPLHLFLFSCTNTPFSISSDLIRLIRIHHHRRAIISPNDSLHYNLILNLPRPKAQEHLRLR